MKRIASIFVLVALSAQVNGVLFSALVFTWNRARIVASCCERRTPDCNGRCFFQKSLAHGDTVPDGDAAKRIADASTFDAVILHRSSQAPVAAARMVCCVQDAPSDGHVVLRTPPPRSV